MAKRSKKVNTPKVPQDGKEAFLAGFTAADCPYDEEHPNFDTWNADWDAAADEASEQRPEEDGGKAGELSDGEFEEGDGAEGEPPPASVVKEEYRARYAEAGHPTHCGDELAVLLNNLCLTKKGIDLPRFEHICEANGVDLSKYNRTTKGWQGRLRMTGRNKLAGKVFAAGGVLRTAILKVDPNNEELSEAIYLEGAEPEYKLSTEWMASRRRVQS